VASTPKCDVLTVAPWIWDMLDTGALIAAGAIRMSEVDAATWQIATVTHAAYHSAKAAAEETEKKRRELVRAAARRAKERTA
jgi:hypothetical protein